MSSRHSRNLSHSTSPHKTKSLLGDQHRLLWTHLYDKIRIITIIACLRITFLSLRKPSLLHLSWESWFQSRLSRRNTLALQPAVIQILATWTKNQSQYWSAPIVIIISMRWITLRHRPVASSTTAFLPFEILATTLDPSLLRSISRLLSQISKVLLSKEVGLGSSRFYKIEWKRVTCLSRQQSLCTNKGMVVQKAQVLRYLFPNCLRPVSY